MATERRPIMIVGADCLIPLTRGLVAVIDAADEPLVRGRSWHAEQRRGTWYAATKVGLGGRKTTTVYLHRLICGFPAGIVDHEDRDGLNCRRENLRDATRAQNGWNATLSAANTSGKKGVSFCRFTGRWKVRIKSNGKEIWVGRFDDIEDASKAHLAAIKQHHGEFARSK